MKNLLLFILFYIVHINCATISKYYCIDDNQGKSCQNKNLEKYQYCSPKEFERMVFSNGCSIFIYTYADITINNNILNNMSKSQLSISSETNCQVLLNANKFEIYSLTFNNVQIYTDLKLITLNTIKLTNSNFNNLTSIVSNSFISDGFSLKSFTSIQTEKLEITFDHNIPILDIFITKSINQHLFNQNNPQVLIYNTISSDLIFGTNYIKLNNLKIISQIYPFISIENAAHCLNIKCHYGLIPNVLLTPIIHMISGKCNCYGYNWPQNPKKIDSYWELDTFYETNERQIQIILENTSTIHLFGNKMPFSIKSNGFLSIYCESVECGIRGQIYTQTPNDVILSTIKGKSTFYVSSIIKASNNGYLHSKSSHLHIIIETCRSSSISSNLSNYVCQSIESDQHISNQIINLAENGQIVYHMKMNWKTITKNLQKIIKFPPLGDVYDRKGNFNLSALFDYFVNKLVISDSTKLSIISSLKTLGNGIVPLDFVQTKGKHHLQIKRDDILLNSLFYHNLYRYNKYLVCSNDQFIVDNWRINFDEIPPTNKEINVPFFNFDETNISFTVRNYQNNETSYCLQMKVDKYPNSAIEFLIYTTDKKLEGKFTWVSGAFVSFVSKRKLSSVRSVMSNPNAKNIVFIALNDLVGELNLRGIRKDANVVIIGASLNIIDEINKGMDEFNFDVVKPVINVSYTHLNSIAYLFCKVNEKKVHVNNFISFASDIVNSKNFEINASNVVFDLSTWKQIENNGIEYKFKNFLLLPFELRPSIKYKNLQKVEFLNDKWKLQFTNQSSFSLNYSTVSDRLLIMTGIDKELKLKIDDSFNLKESILKPIEIGYNVFRKFTNLNAFSLLEENEEPFLNVDYFNSFKSIMSNYFDEIKENEAEKIVFERNWNLIRDFSHNLVYKSGKKSLEIENYPINHMNKIDFSSKGKIKISSIDKNSLNSSSKITVKHSFPLLINGHQEYEIPSDINVEFENITVVSKKATLDLSNNDLINVYNFRASSGSSCRISTDIQINEAIELEPNSYTLFESPIFSSKLKIHYFYSLDQRYPLLVIKKGDLQPNSIILHHISNEQKLTDDEIIANYSSMPQMIFKKETKENECDKMKKLFVFDSDDKRFQNQNNIFTLFCEFSQIGLFNYTNLGLNITANVIEGEIDFFTVKREVNLIAIVILVFVVFILAFVVYSFVIIKKDPIIIVDESNEPLNSLNNPPLQDINVLINPVESEDLPSIE